MGVDVPVVKFLDWVFRKPKPESAVVGGQGAPAASARPKRRHESGHWPPISVFFSTFDNHCNFCGEEIVGLRDRICPTDQYGWIHYRCASGLSGKSDRPRPPITDHALERVQCEGITQKGERCKSKTSDRPRTRDGSVVAYYCGRHESQRPEGAPRPRPSRRLEIFDVVGESHAPGYPDSLMRLAGMLEATDGQGEAPAALLVREPHENHAEAVEVHVPALGHRIGYLARSDADKLAPKLDAGATWSTWVTAVMPSDDHQIVGVRIGGFENNNA